MDPLSISASVVGLLGFSGSCAKQLRQLIHNVRYAPTEILALSNEVADLNVLLTDVEATSQAIENASTRDEAQSNFVNAVTSHLAKARSRLVQLDTLTAALFTHAPDRSVKFH